MMLELHCWVPQQGCIAGCHTGVGCIAGSHAGVALLGLILGLHCWVLHWGCIAGAHIGVALLGLALGLHCWMSRWSGLHCWGSHWGCIAGSHTSAALLGPRTELKQLCLGPFALPIHHSALLHPSSNFCCGARSPSKDKPNFFTGWKRRQSIPPWVHPSGGTASKRSHEVGMKQKGTKGAARYGCRWPLVASGGLQQPCSSGRNAARQRARVGRGTRRGHGGGGHGQPPAPTASGTNSASPNWVAWRMQDPARPRWLLLY